ncbi:MULTISPECIES: Crp/Fnr family transcriptional regulator [Methylobacterium]|uniref:Crp/Fnr family transcriptional regulator n=1 Tax=Methylobacterium TaxID=407 RepID=UPI00104BDC92|nr:MULTISPECIES: Crp/Fnr family transcriptional regulator [Methylobacterium]MDR7039895.1 CRP-like cAMP-binding protein [Methylobacterium sp. BE186]
MVSAAEQSLNVLCRKLETIGALTPQERQAIAGLPATVRVLSAGQDIARDGDRSGQCCLVLQGWACRYKLLSRGRRQIFSFHIPGDIPDLEGLQRPVMDHSVATLTKATIACISHEALRELIATHPGLAAIFWRSAFIDAAVLRAWMLGLGRRSAFENMAHLFCELYLKLRAVGLAGDGRCPMPVTQVDLGDALGLSNVHVNRVLQTLRGQKLVSLQNSTLVLEDWQALVRISEFDPAYLGLER